MFANENNMMVIRLLRKWRELRSYRGLAYSLRDVFPLGLFALVRFRIIPPGAARAFLGGSRACVHPRLTATSGLPVNVDLANPGQFGIFDELFVDKIYELNQVPFKPDVILDCGCYCGYFTLLAAGKFPDARIVCFEPNPANVEMMKRQFEVANLNCEIVEKAVSIRDGFVNFAGEGCGGAITDGTLHVIKVETADISAYLDACQGKRLLLKMDIEGEEQSVLPAALQKLPDETSIFLETHYSDDICRTLLAPYKQAGFDIIEIRRRPAQDAAYDYIDWYLSRSKA